MLLHAMIIFDARRDCVNTRYGVINMPAVYSMSCATENIEWHKCANTYELTFSMYYMLRPTISHVQSLSQQTWQRHVLGCDAPDAISVWG
jgi:hypothetical protein